MYSDFPERVSRWHSPLLWSCLLLLFPLIVEVTFSDFVREGEYNSRIGWAFIAALLIRVCNRRWVTALVLLPFAIGGTFDIGYAFSFGGVFTTATMEAVAYTDSKEISEYLSTYFSFWLLLLITIFWSLYAVAIYLSKKRNVDKATRVAIVISLIFVVVAGYRISVMHKYHDTIPGVLGTIPSWYRGAAELELAFDARKKLAQEYKGHVAIAADKPQLHIFIIGESATRNHMGLYGYHRDTTPRLNEVREDLVVLSDVISAQVQTQASLCMALTEVSSDNASRCSTSLSIIDIANLAGYKTWWISNQQPVRATISAMANQASVPHFISNDFNGVEVNRYDEYMLDSIRTAFADPAKEKAVFIHTMGSHAQYRSRYSDEWDYFQNADVKAYTNDPGKNVVSSINEYDNSIRYTDYFIREVLDAARKYSDGRDVSLTYFSDHGEEVYQIRNLKGHSPDNLTANMMEIPFFAWFSDNQAQQARNLQEHRDQPFMLDNLYQYAVDVMRIETDASDLSLSPASPTFRPATDRRLYGKSYGKDFSVVR